MKTRTKILLGIALAVLLGVAGGAYWLSSSLDSLVASAIRKYGTEITGVSVKITSVKIAPADGSAALRGLVVGNPQGYQTDHVLSLGEIGMKLDIGSLTGDVILIKQITILNPMITYEYGSGGSNLDAIQRNVDRYVAEHAGDKGRPKDKSGGKKLIIESLSIRNAKANVSAAVLQGKATSVAVPDLHLRDIGRKSNGATAGEAAKQILGALTQNVVKATASLNLGGIDPNALKKGAGDKIKGLFK